jgi:hypothetical protein
VENGYEPLSAIPMDWPAGDLTVTGMEYEFVRPGFDPSTQIVVDNFMILPDGRFARDMEPMNFDATNVRRRGFGGAQVQFLFDSTYKMEQRQAIVGQFLDASRPMISAIGSGVKN